MEILKAYTDGSFDKDNNRGSWGVVLLDENDNLIKEYYGMVTMPHFLEMWNVAGELFAAIKAISLVQEYKKPIRIYHDYEGVAKWATGEWKAKKKATQQYRDIAQRLLGPGVISFEWVRGHSKNKWNDRADELCRIAMREDDRK